MNFSNKIGPVVDFGIALGIHIYSGINNTYRLKSFLNHLLASGDLKTDISINKILDIDFCYEQNKFSVHCIGEKVKLMVSVVYGFSTELRFIA